MQFIVKDNWKNEYIAEIDTWNGDITYTNNEEMARIFAGEVWKEHWAGERYSCIEFIE